ncbi:MAG: glucosaminidase domain-containing protein [Paramuribaculum sp.]|nr:glucosaminidase domain-containing protein [Paramuribaculum sp.]
MNSKRIGILIITLLTVAMSGYAKKTRIAKIKHKIPADTIVIPETVYFETLPFSDSLTVEETSGESIPMEILTPCIADIDGSLSIMGKATVDVETMVRFVVKTNPDFNPEIARAFYDVGELYGVRGDVALCQAIIETGWFLFTGGTAVTLDQNNFCGLGVTKKGMKGHSFATVTDGVKAQIQHLYAYASKENLPAGEEKIDPRFSLVSRGVAPTWNDLNQRWAANSRYGESIIRVYKDMLSMTE